MSDWLEFWITFASLTVLPALASAAVFGMIAWRNSRRTFTVVLFSSLGGVVGFGVGLLVTPYVFKAIS